jgi:hypothetical protein
MRRLSIVALAAIALMPVAWSQAAPNVLQNPGFELDAVLDAEPNPTVTPWTTFGNSSTASANGSPVRSGIGSLRLEGVGGYSVPGAYQFYPASPGQLWNLQGYVRTEDPQLEGDNRGLLKIVFRDEAMDLEPGSITIGTADAQPFPGILSAPQLTSASPEDTWVFVQAQGVAPETAVEVRFFALFVDGAGAGVNFFDDLRASLAGDFDADFDVDSDDFTVWKAAYGATDAGDSDGDSDSDGSDFLLWQRFFAAPVGGAGAVPEPASAALLAAALALVVHRRPRGRARQ